MMFSFQPKPEYRPTFEELFFTHYSRLHQWALQLTGSDRSAAEDLVQELYVRIAGIPVSEQIEDADGYLFSVLRNLQYARVRRARTSAIDDLSIVDYDSAQRSLRAIDRNGLLFIQDELHLVCDHLCERKETSRSSSIFILRYFLGYYPSEVMKVSQSTRGAVDKAIRVARNEARLILERPGALRQPASSRESKDRTPRNIADSSGLFLALRAKIFRSCTGDCLSNDGLKTKYQQLEQSITTEELAHLVSCPQCLDQVNRLLQLPLLEERSPDETIGRDTPQGPDGSAGAAPTIVSSRSRKRRLEDPQKLRKRMQRCAQDVHEHRPQRLSIVVDGDIRASQKVTAPLGELHVELRPMEAPSFVEVLSEQGVCLAFVALHTLVPEASLEQIQEFELSDDRTMKVGVSFAAESPTVQVVYNDPLIEFGSAIEEAAAEKLAVICPTFAVIPSTAHSLRAGISDLFAAIRRWRTRPFVLNMHPLLAGTVFFALCTVICFFLWTTSRAPISARTLLNRAEQSDVAVTTLGHKVIYQKVKITTTGHSLERAIYRDSEKKHRLKRQPLDPLDEKLKQRLDSAKVNWDDPLSAADYGAWHDGQSEVHDQVTRTGQNLLTLTTSAGSASPVIQESLTVRTSDFHPVERTIEFRGEGTVEIAELNYDVMPWGTVNQELFEPISGHIEADGSHPQLSVAPAGVPSHLDLDVAELSARLVLHRLHADTGEHIRIARSRNDIEVRGFVETNERKEQIVKGLLHIPHVHSSLWSVQEIGSTARLDLTPARRATFTYSLEARPSELEQYFRERQLPTDQLAVIARTLFDQSLSVQQAEVHLTELLQRFTNSDELPVAQQHQLAELSSSYIDAIEAGLDASDRARDSIGLTGLDVSSGTEAPASQIASSVRELNLVSEVRRYQELCRKLITSGSEEAASAPALSVQLRDSSKRIRSITSQIRTSLFTEHN